MPSVERVITGREDNVIHADFGLARSLRDAEAAGFGEGNILEKVPEHVRQAVANELAARLMAAHVDWSGPAWAAELLAAGHDRDTGSPNLNDHDAVLVKHLASTEYSALQQTPGSPLS